MPIIYDVDEMQPLLRDSVAALVRAQFSKSEIRSLRQSPLGFAPARWKSLAEAGWLGMRLPESLGGAGLGPPHSCTAVEVMAGELLPEPYIACALMPSLIFAAAQPAAVERHARLLCTGEGLFSLAWRDDRIGPQKGTIFSGGRVSGRKLMVPAASAATTFIVSCLHEGADSLALVDAASPGVSIDSVRLIDGSVAGTVSFDNVPATELTFPAGLTASSILDAVMDEARLAIAVALISAAREALNATTRYMRERVQFGKALSEFQVLQHRIVDLNIELKLTEACCRAALRSIGDGDSERRRVVAAAKSTAAEAATKVTQSAIQLHGAIGYADEADIGLYLKMVLRHAGWLGGADEERRRFVDGLDVRGVSA